MSMVALIPARGGSKGIPGKNIKSLCGKPLIYWGCKAAEECAAIDAVYVATEDPRIAEAVQGLGLSKVRVIDRDLSTTTDTASTESVMIDFAGRVAFDHLVLIQATSPLICAADLARGAELIASGAFDSVLSVVRQTRFRWTLADSGAAAPENYRPEARPRRQEFSGFHVENGAFYMTGRKGLIDTGCRLNGRIGAVEMPEESYFEIDELHDWTIIESLLAHRLAQPSGTWKDRLAGIRLVASDVDGCLTDTGMYYGIQGEVMKKFSARDGHGFGRLRRAGFLTGIITQEYTEIVARRAAKLQIDEVHQGAADKVQVMEEILRRRGLDWSEVAYLGDDEGDAALLQRVGFSACPADALPEIRRIVDWVIDIPGGAGAFRALADRLLVGK